MSKNQSAPQSGYDVPVYGLDDGSFYELHILAISCISISLVCVCVSLAMSFTVQNRRGFCSDRQKRNRFVVYMAFCDGLLHVTHGSDHLHVIFEKDHVRPKELCQFYAFVLFETAFSQKLLVNLIAVNAFSLMYFNYNLNFGKWDWKLLLWICVAPFVCATASVAMNKMGPTGAYCYFDAINGTMLYVAFNTILVITIVLVNTTLYLLTWLKLRTQTRAIKQTVGRASAGLKASQRAAKSMTLFVVAFIVQWWALAFAGAWSATGSILPQEVIMTVVFFSNIGGVLNLIVYILIRRTKSESEGPSRVTSTVDISTIAERGTGSQTLK